MQKERECTFESAERSCGDFMMEPLVDISVLYLFTQLRDRRQVLLETQEWKGAATFPV